MDLERAPVRLGHYVLLHELGQGGMGVVYAAYDERLDRRVAIKLLRKQGRGRAELRLIREAQALARLSHPNVVQVYEIGELEQQTFLVMELIEGLTLSHWRKQRQRSRAEILAVFVAAGRGLAAAHAKGLIHRDFKPDNVMIRRDGQAVVMDFGLARGDDRSGSPSTIETDPELDSDPTATGDTHASALDRTLTVAGTIMGTPGYMAPEQLFGDPISDRCDQFSFCAALWEALHDKLPFRGKTIEAFTRSVLNGKPEASESNDVPAWLREVLERGLARDPAERWPSMTALLDALQPNPSRRRVGWLAAAGVLGLGLAGVTASLVLDERARARAANERAEQLAACELEGDAIAADWNEEVAAAIEQAFLATNSTLARSAWQHTRPWLEAYAREWSTLRSQTCVETTVEQQRSAESQSAVVDCLDEGRIAFASVLETLSGLSPEDAPMVTNATSIAARLPPPSHCANEALLQHRRRPPTELRAEVIELRRRIDRAAARNLVGDHERALAEAQAALEQANALAWSPLVVHAGLTVSDTYVRLGKYEEARDASQQAYWAAAAKGDELEMLKTATELGFVLGYNLTSFEEGRGWAMLAKGLVERLELTDTIHEARVLDRLGVVLGSMGKPEQAIPHHTRAVEIFERVLGSEHPTVGTALINKGLAYSASGQERAALDCTARALEILEAALGSEHTTVGNIHNNIGVALTNLGDLEGGLAAHRRALAIWEAALGSEHPDVALALYAVGRLLCMRNECEEALILHRRALRINEAALGPADISVGFDHQAIAVALQALGSHAEAVEQQRRALAMLEAVLPPEHYDLLVARVHLGAMLRDRGDLEQALELLRPTLEQLERQGHTDVLGAGLLEYGLVLLDRGDVATAREQLERAVTLHEQDPSGVDSARARFALAKAMWASSERARAQELIDAARSGYQSAGRFGARGLADLEAWLHARR